MKVMDRFWKKVDKSSDCWQWTAADRGAGYGIFWMNGKNHLSHRVAYSLTYGEIPEGMCVLHRCDNRGCVNPDHLFLGTHQDNSNDMVAKGRAKGQRGSDCPTSKLSWEDVDTIRCLVGGGETQAEVATLYGIDPSNVSRIVRGKTWRSRSLSKAT